MVVPPAKELEDLVTGSEIARRIGMSRQRVHQFAAQPDFPQALGRLGSAKVWRWSDILNWLHAVGRSVVEISAQPTRQRLNAPSNRPEHERR